MNKTSPDNTKTLDTFPWAIEESLVPNLPSGEDIVEEVAKEFEGKGMNLHINEIYKTPL